MPKASRCYDFPQAFSLNQHKEPGAGVLLNRDKPQPWADYDGEAGPKLWCFSSHWGLTLLLPHSRWAHLGAHRVVPPPPAEALSELALQLISHSLVSFRPFFPLPNHMAHPRGSFSSPLPSAGVGGGGPCCTDLDQVRSEALGPQPFLEAVCAAQGTLQAAGLCLQQGGADVLVSPVVLVLGGQPGDVDQPPALGIIGVVA